ncbi:hypothetical protein BKA70DRAFT_1332537, partial [Coprinopsis sp. MPI-PUGE-AT-0042]
MVTCRARPSLPVDQPFPLGSMVSLHQLCTFQNQCVGKEMTKVRTRMMEREVAPDANKTLMNKWTGSLTMPKKISLKVPTGNLTPRKRWSQRYQASGPTPSAVLLIESSSSNFTPAHFCQHPFFAERREKEVWTAEKIRTNAVQELYLFCEQRGLREAWAYFWANWYSPQRWKLWA